jgi:hypothetical protein
MSESRASRIGVHAAAWTLAGIVLSGPMGLWVVEATHPQPVWTHAAVFAESFHPVQMFPYLGGLLLIAGLVLLLAATHAAARAEEKVRTSAAMVFTAVYASLISINYIVQTTFLPALARRYEDAHAPIVEALTMVNPTSLAWGIEMWGYAFLGVATWLVAPVFRGSRLERAAAVAFAANGPLSVAGALWTVARPGWVMTPAGYVAFGLWNVLLAAMAVLALISFRGRASRDLRLRADQGAAPCCTHARTRSVSAWSTQPSESRSLCS